MFVTDVIFDGLEIVGGIEKLYSTLVRTLEDGLVELPDGVRGIVQRSGYGGEVIDKEAANQPSSTTETA